MTHHTTVVTIRRDTTVKLYARCACGWLGKMRADGEAAAEDARRHSHANRKVAA